VQQGTAIEDIHSPAQYSREKLEAAKRRVAALKGFYIHLTAFVLVNLGLTAINIGTGSDGGSNGYGSDRALALSRTPSQCSAAAPTLSRTGKIAKSVSCWRKMRVR
jgi:hypothetical protein